MFWMYINVLIQEFHYVKIFTKSISMYLYKKEKKHYVSTFLQIQTANGNITVKNV